MKLIEQSVEIEYPRDYDVILGLVEAAGRTCYKSGEFKTVKKAEKFINGLIKSGHDSVIEHASMTMRFVTDRSMTHQLARHRMTSVSQESQRYCNYTQEKFDNGLTFIKPLWYDTGNGLADNIFNASCRNCEADYCTLISCKNANLKPEQARAVLINAVKTEYVLTSNMREWRHIFKVRCFGHADPMMKDLMQKALKIAYTFYPVFFKDLYKKLQEENEAHKA